MDCPDCQGQGHTDTQAADRGNPNFPFPEPPWPEGTGQVRAVEPYDEMGRGDPRGLWGMKCWNAMSTNHQEQLVVTGKFRGYDGGTCDRPAEVGIETDADMNPGPRFYCRPCGIHFLVDGWMALL